MTAKFYVYRLQVSLNKISNDGPVSIINFEDLKMENERLQSELDRTNKVKITRNVKQGDKYLLFSTFSEEIAGFPLLQGCVDESRIKWLFS